MNTELLKQYAQLIVQVGANVQPGQTVRLAVQTDQQLMAQLVTEACYQAGAAHVDITWQCDATDRISYQYATVETLGKVQPWEEEKARQMVRELPVRIHIISADPDALSGIPADKLSAITRMRAAVLKTYRDGIEGRHQWVIAAAASPAWAKKVFPQLPEQQAVEQLWQAILACVHITGNQDPAAVWHSHTARMDQKAAWLNAQQLVQLRYASANGTNFTVGLIPEARWGGAKEPNSTNGVVYVPNLPTEEVYTTPMRGVAEGRLVATKPLSWNGQVIDGFVVDFKDGKVCSCSARVGEDILKKMFAIDEGAAMLGEVALVPKESPINRSGLLFYNTLFDENACCHVAVGRGFDTVLEGYEDMTQQEIRAKGINDSGIHVDFMVGSEDLNITGIRADGSEVPVFVNGTWA